jgi:hypothetical protein
MNPDRDKAVDRLATATPPHAGISKLTGVEHHASFIKNNSPIHDFAGPAVLVGHHCCHDRGSGVALVEYWGGGAPTQEGPY